MTRIICAEFGELFYGSIEQFENTFGNMGGDEKVMKDVIEADGYAFHIFDGELIDFNGMTEKEKDGAINIQIATTFTLDFGPLI